MHNKYIISILSLIFYFKNCLSREREFGSLFYSQSFLFRLMHAHAGELPLPVVRLLSSMRHNGKSVDRKGAGLGFTLPANIGDLDPDITELNLSGCNLIGL